MQSASEIILPSSYDYVPKPPISAFSGSRFPFNKVMRFNSELSFSDAREWVVIMHVSMITSYEKIYLLCHIISS